MSAFELAQRLVDTLPVGNAGLFNPWKESLADDEPINTPQAKLERLAAHLDCQPRFILCGEAPGYQGCARSGVPRHGDNRAMRFDVITLFPELFGPFLQHGINRRAFESRQVDVRLWNPRDHAEGNYRRVDDRPFGGGPGMVMMAEPLWRCLQAIRTDRAEPEGQRAPVVLFSPIGQRLDHAAVEAWSGSQGAVLVCGRYEGIDQRFIDACVDLQISLGDFVLSGGEIAALALLDAGARLIQVYTGFIYGGPGLVTGLNARFAAHEPTRLERGPL